MNRLPDPGGTRITLQPARPEDEAFLFEVYARTRTEELAPTGWSEPQREGFLRMQFQAQDRHYRENYPGAEFQIIQVDGEPAGRFYVHHRANEIRIMDIALLPGYRRRGIGTALLEEILSAGAQSGKMVSIHVEVFNPALRWYERLGFKRAAANGPYLLMEWTAKPAACGPMADTLR